MPDLECDLKWLKNKSKRRYTVHGEINVHPYVWNENKFKEGFREHVQNRAAHNVCQYVIKNDIIETEMSGRGLRDRFSMEEIKVRSKLVAMTPDQLDELLEEAYNLGRGIINPQNMG